MDKKQLTSEKERLEHRLMLVQQKIETLHKQRLTFEEERTELLNDIAFIEIQLRTKEN